MTNSEIILYQNLDGNIKIDVRLEDETVWLTQEQMAMLISKYIKKVVMAIRPLEFTALVAVGAARGLHA